MSRIWYGKPNTAIWSIWVLIREERWAVREIKRMETLSHEYIPLSASPAEAGSFLWKPLDPTAQICPSSHKWTGKVKSDPWLLCLIQGAGTRDGTLIRNIVSRSEIDLNLIKCQFQKMYGKTLSSMIVVSQEFPILTLVWNRDITGISGCCYQCHKSHVSIPSFPVSITLLHSLLHGM